MSPRRLVAVLGYSDGNAERLHPVCAARVARAERIARGDDVVLFSGWARSGTTATEAELMAESWTGLARWVLLDRGARSTAGNAVGIARAARALGVDEVVLVTSSWHARRALALVRASLTGSGALVLAVATEERPSPSARIRELACWLLVPVLALATARTR